MGVTAQPSWRCVGPNKDRKEMQDAGSWTVCLRLYSEVFDQEESNKRSGKGFY